MKWRRWYSQSGRAVMKSLSISFRFLLRFLLLPQAHAYSQRHVCYRPCDQRRRPAQSAKGSKKNEFEYVETLLRTPRRIQLRKKIEQIEEEIDPRKEALTAYQVQRDPHSHNCGSGAKLAQIALSADLLNTPGDVRAHADAV